MDIRPKNKTYVHITLLKGLKLKTFRVKTPNQIACNSALRKKQIVHPCTNLLTSLPRKVSCFLVFSSFVVFL